MRQPLAPRFETFGTDHLVWIGLTVAGCVALVLLGRRLRARGVEPSSLTAQVPTPQRRAERVAAVVLLAVSLPLQGYQLLPGDYSLRTSLPFHLSDLSWMLAAFALWTRDPRAAQVLYYWGLTLVPQAILTPDLAEVFPHPRYLMFWAIHLLVVWAAVWLTWSPGGHISWRGFRFAVGVTLVWAAAVMVLNAFLGTNYGFLNAKPAGGSVLDLFPPWPWYVAVQLVVVSGAWALMTWPWVRARSRIGRAAPSGGRLGTS